MAKHLAPPPTVLQLGLGSVRVGTWEGAQHRADHEFIAQAAAGFPVPEYAYCTEYPHRGAKHLSWIVSYDTEARNKAAFQTLEEAERNA